MSSTTTNLHLLKPAGQELVDVDIINNNMDLIDTAVKAAENPISVATGTNTYATGINQITFKDNNAWKGLDEVRLYNGTDALYCKQGVTTGLLMQDNQIKVVPVTWNGNVPAVGTMKGYISADGNYHLYDSSTSADSTSLATLRDSVSTKLTGGFDGVANRLNVFHWSGGENCGFFFESTEERFSLELTPSFITYNQEPKTSQETARRIWRFAPVMPITQTHSGAEQTFDGTASAWTIDVSKGGYTPISYALAYGNSPYIKLGVESVGFADGRCVISGYGKTYDGITRKTTPKIIVTWIKNF